MIETTFRGLLITILPDGKPLPEGDPSAIMCGIAVKLRVHDADGHTIAEADKNGYRVGEWVSHSMACPLTNLQRYIESTAPPVTKE